MTTADRLCGSTVCLPHTERLTTSLGFGASALMSGSTDKAASLGLLEAAYDAGIRHFDVAPMYGLGAAEACVGEFLSRHRQDTTVTTKFGLLPPKSTTVLRLARSLGKPILRKFPGMRKSLLQGAESAIPSGTRVVFTAGEARRSLDASLGKLRVDRIDLWLLHEVRADDLRDDELLRFLEQSKTEGKIGAFGVASESGEISALLQQHPAYCPVVQFDWSALDTAPPKTNAFELHHRSLTERFRELHIALSHNSELCRSWSDRIGHDLGRAEELAALMLKAALECNPGGVVLFSSRNPKHVAKNARVAEDVTLASAALLLHRLLQAEGRPA